MGNIEPKKKSRFKKNIDVLKLPKKTYKTAKKIAKKGLSKSNLALASGLDIFLEKEIGVRKQFFGFLNFIPHKIRKYSKILFPLALMFLILKWDLPIPIDIKKAFALFICIGLLWGLESLPMVVTAIMVPVLIVLLGLGNQTEALSSFSNPVIYLLFGGLILAVAFRKNGLDRRFAFKLLSLSGGDSKKILFYFMLSSAVLGMWMSNTATVALLVPIAISISSYIKKEDNKKFISVLILCIGIGSSIGGMSAITGSTPNAITSAFINENNIFSFSQWMQIGVPISVICFMSAYFLLINMFKIKSKNIIENSKEFFKIDEPLTYNQKKTIAIFLPTIIFWIFGKDIAIYFNLNPNIFSSTIVSLIAVIFLFSVKIISWSDARSIAWEVLLLIGGGLALGKVLINTGASKLFSDFILSYFTGIHPLIVLMVIMYMAIFLANFVNNSSTVIILVPTLMALGDSMNLSPIMLALAVAHAVALSFITPISIPAFSIIYSTHLVDRKDMIKSGLIIGFINTIIVSFILILYSTWRGF